MPRASHAENGQDLRCSRPRGKQSERDKSRKNDAGKASSTGCKTEERQDEPHGNRPSKTATSA